MDIAEDTRFCPAVLRRMRKQRRMSLEAVALAAGLYDKGQLSRFERGQAVPLATTLARLLHVLRPEPDSLYALFGIRQGEPPPVAVETDTYQSR
jgi:transcriptional regulator with XRE-family HTH domain